MDFSLTDEQQDFVSAIRDFCSRETGTQEQRERLTNGYSELHSAEIYSKMAELGWLGVMIDPEVGGSGGGMVDACLFMEETSRGMAPIGGYGTTLIVAGAVQRFGSDEQKREILGGIAKGSVEAIAMTEPEAGSDVGSLTTKAERVNGGYVLNGQKVFCSNAHISDHVLVVCRTTKGEYKHEGLSMIFVPTDNPAMEIKPIDTIGGRETNYLYLTDCEVPAEAVLGEVDQAWTQLMAGLNVERLILAAIMLGVGERALRRHPRLRQGAQAVRPADRLLPGAPAPARRHRHRARGRPADDLLGRRQGRRGPRPDAPARGLDGEAVRHRGRPAGGARRACR